MLCRFDNGWRKHTIMPLNHVSHKFSRDIRNNVVILLHGRGRSFLAQGSNGQKAADILQYPSPLHDQSSLRIPALKSSYGTFTDRARSQTAPTAKFPETVGAV